MLINISDLKSMYTLVTDQWTVLDAEYNNILPHI